MLSELIKKRIEQKSGMRVRYVRDCTTLAEKISVECNCQISGSTIRRLFGMGPGAREPRGSTLDIIAAYLGHSDWDELLNSFSNAAPEERKIINELRPSNLKVGQKFKFTYKPDTTVSIEYCGKYKFKVLSALNSRLQEGDVFKASIIALHHPLFILDIEGDNITDGRLVEGKISGITSIKKI